MAALAISCKGRVSRLVKMDTAITEISTTNTAAVRKMLEIMLRMALVSAVGTETMTIPLVPDLPEMGMDTTYR